MSDCESDLTIDLKGDDLVQKDFSLPSTSSEGKSGHIEKYELKELAEEMDSSISENNEDSDSESGEHCAICLSLIRGKIGFPDAEGCEHYFCLLCILEWTKSNPTCPQDRRPFKRILVRESICGEVVSTLEANKSKAEEEGEQEREDFTYCEICGSCEREDCLLLCDGCDLGFHLDCLSPPLQEVPIEEWFCPLCVAADLPQVVKKAENQKKNDKETKNQRKKKKKSVRKPRMIPRTRATERVLRRINKTRFKEGKNQDLLGDEDLKRGKGSVVQLFKKAKPFGSIASSDIDAVFNQDEYADKLLWPSAPILSNNEKKDVAVKAITDTYSNPLPSYSGRSSHPKVENCQVIDTTTDLLINILEEQDILLSKTKDVSLTKERKLIKKDGAKSLDFNIDRENRVMSELLPSQKKALESKIRDDKYDKEKENSHSRESKYKKSEEKYKSSRDNFSNGHSSNYKRSYPSPRKSRERDAHSSYKSPKSYRNYDKKSDRRYDQDYRKRDARRHRERSRSRERKDYNNASGDYYDRRRSRRSRSKSRERRRTERKHNRRSRTPERHKNKERNHKDKLPASSFWGKDFVNTFMDFDSKSNFDTYNDNVSFHTTEVPSTPQKIDVHLFDVSDKTEEFSTKKVNNFKEEIGLGFETFPISESIHDRNTFYKSEYKEKLESPDFHSKCDNNKNNIIEEKRKLEESDYSSKNETEAKKRRLKSLFGEEGSDQDSPIHHFNKLVSSSHSNDSAKENKKDLLLKESSRQNSILEADSFQNSASFKEEFKEVCEQNILPINLPIPLCVTSPTQSCENELDSLEDITIPSKSSRDFILKSLYGNRQTQTQEKYSSSPTKPENKDSIVDSIIYTDPQDTTEVEKQKNKLNDKNIDNARDNLNEKSNSETSSIEAKKYSNNKTSKMFAHLFGDSSDSEASNSALDKNSKSVTINKVSNEISEPPKTADVSKDLQNGSEDKLSPQKTVVEEKNEKIIANAIEKKDKPHSEGTQGIDSKSSALSNKIKVNKLHLEMKVVEETKKFLNPFYIDRGFSKQTYKEIVSKCVNKVLEVESGNTVDPKKIQKLVNGYVEVYMHRNKKNSSNSSSSAPPPNSTV